MTKQTLLIARALFVAACLSFATMAQADLLAKIRADGKIRVGLTSSTPPFSLLDASGQLAGSDIDTARLLARDLGVTLEIVKITNGERIPALQEHRVDLVIAALSITPERERQISFSVAYAQIPIVIAAPSGYQLSSMLDLNGKTVGVLANSSNHANLSHDAPRANIIQYAENDKLIAGYLAGEFDIISTPQSIVDTLNLTKPKRPLIEQFTQSVFDIAIGMPNGEKALRDWTNTWVVSNLRNDNLSEIYRKHHGRSLPRSILPSSGASKK